MRTTLIYCGVGVAGFNPDRPKGDREGSWIGHGVASVAANTQANGFLVGLIDLRKLRDFDHFVDLIKENPSDVYGLSVSAVDRYPAILTAALIKQHIPHAKVIVGGIHPSVLPGDYVFDVIDTVVTGEGEITFPKLLQMVLNNEPLPKRIQGEKPDLDRIPWVAREMFDYQRELECNFAPDQKLPSITMLAGRGCPYQCAYCQPAENAVFGKPHRMRSVRDVINELVVLKTKYAYKSITFWDDTFTFNRKWIEEFCQEYRYEGIGASIAACSRADIICNNENMIEELASIGLDWLVVGFETGSQRLLDLISKGTTVEQNLEAARICRKHGIKIFGTFMYGLPTETPQESRLTKKMIDAIGAEHTSPFWYVPIKGTRLYDYCEQQDLILESAKEQTIERTGKFMPTIKGVDYGCLQEVMR